MNKTKKCLHILLFAILLLTFTVFTVKNDAYAATFNISCSKATVSSNGKTFTFKGTQTVQLKAVYNKKTVKASKVTWSVDKPKLATVNTKGKLTIKSTGKFTLKAIYKKHTVKKTIKVKKLPAPAPDKTLYNLFKSAILPIGSTMYQYGGGHGSDSTRVGLNPQWKISYDQNNNSSGLDCSGYIGWTIYQVMRKDNTTTSSLVHSTLTAKGWGTKMPLSEAGNLQPGDILANSGHVWMVFGRCQDGSVVILHSSSETNGGPQFAGTPGEASQLAKTYMMKYSGYQTHKYSSTYSNFYLSSHPKYKTTTVFRWNTSVLSDPEGLREMSADQIFAKMAALIGD